MSTHLSVGAALAVLAASEPDPVKVGALVEHPNPAVRLRANQIMGGLGADSEEHPAPGETPRNAEDSSGAAPSSVVAPSAPATLPTEPMLRWFRYQHLPDRLAAVSAPFAELAGAICRAHGRSAERTVALRRLLEAKDAAVRAALLDADG